MTQQQAIQAIRMILDAIVDSVKVAGSLGAPAGTVYSALMAHGITLDQYYQLTGALIRAGRLRQEGDLLFAVENANAQG